MNRREFIGALTATVAAASAPAVITDMVMKSLPETLVHYPDSEWLEIFKRLLVSYMDAFGGQEPMPGSHAYELIATITDVTFNNNKTLYEGFPELGFGGILADYH